jgi:HD-GYP domain-containing protein (c-di-GMP phosphodiesterase class II)
MSHGATRLAEPLGALSLATDFAVGLPSETALAATVLAVRIGEKCGLSADGLKATYYASLTRWVGCTATAAEGASLALGEDQALNYALSACDWTDVDQVQEALKQYVAVNADPAARERAFEVIRMSHEQIPTVAAMHCAQAVVLSSRLACPDGVTSLLGHMYDRWDGAVAGSAGDAIPLPARIIPVAACAELFRRIGGASAAVDAVRSRSGGQLDPELCGLLQAEAESLFADLEAGSRWELFLDAEPGASTRLEPEGLAEVAEVFGDFIDAKSPWFLGHSRRVADLASRAAHKLGSSQAEVQELRLAGLVHDIGRSAVPNGVWDKQGALTWPERSKAETHTYHTYEILARSSAFRPLAERASATHERCDGSGYHRRVRVEDLATMILGAADMYDALTHHRPWRPAHSAEEAARTMAGEVSASRFPHRVVHAVLEVAGHPDRSTKAALPVGLTAREREVLALLAAGCSDKAIARRLGISVKTAGHHASSIYKKTGAQGRAQVAIFATENRALLA